jgi:hypothetical protein
LHTHIENSQRLRNAGSSFEERVSVLIVQRLGQKAPQIIERLDQKEPNRFVNDYKKANEL